MSDIKGDAIKGEVLVPASRFLPKCECGTQPIVCTHIVEYGESHTLQVHVRCADCTEWYEQELPYGVEGIPHGTL